MNVRSGWSLFLIFLTLAVIYKDFCMETRLCNISETTKAIILTITIIENVYKVLQDLSEKNSLNMAYLIFRGVHNFQQATFKLI